MNNSPFEIFRRNLKPLMVLLTGLALFAFVVLPVVDSYMRQNYSGGGDPVVARFDGKSLTRSRVEYFTRNHHEMVGFLRQLADTTIQRGGAPRTAGFRYDPQTKQVLQLGINQTPGTETSVRTIMFAAEAEKAGFELDDNAIRSWLDRFTDGMISDSDITGMLMTATQNRMGRPHLIEQLRSHLLADVYLRRGYAGLYSGDNPSAGTMMTPAEQWAAFKKLNQTATIDAYGVLVNDYVEQTEANPPESVVQSTYQEGKDRDPSDQSPEPAFHRRYEASFEILTGQLDTFLEEETAKISEQQLRDEYQRRLDGGQYQLPAKELDALLQEAAPDEAEVDEAEMDEAAADDAGKDGAGDAGKDGADDAGKDNADPDSAAADAKSAAADEQADTDSESADATPSSDGPSPPNDADSAADDSGQRQSDGDQPVDQDAAAPAAGDAQAGDEKDNAAPPADQAATRSGLSAIRLTALQQDADSPQQPEPAAADDPAPQPDKIPAAPVTEIGEPAEPQAQKESAAGDSGGDPTESKGDGQEPEAKDQTKPQDDPETDPTAGDEPPAGDDKPTDDESEADDNAQPKVESFEDVRERLAEELAFPAARQRMNDAANLIYKTMQSYFTDRAIHLSNLEVGQASDPPQRPDLKALAEQHQFEFKTVGPVDQTEIAAEPIATSMDAQTPFGSRGPNFTLMMFGFSMGQNQVEPREKFSPLQTADFMSGATYVSWKVDDRKAYTPTLDEVRDEVVDFIRMREARQLAQKAAEDLVQEAAASDKPLAELIPADKTDNLHEGLGPFKWLDNVGFGVTMGNVPELDSVGEAFMAAVFEAEIDEYQVAPNQPQRVVYVVKPTKFEPSTDVLRQQFREPVNRRNLAAVDAGVGAILGDFFESIDESTGFSNLIATDQ